MTDPRYDQLSKVPATSVDRALQGKLAGAQITENNGAPGGGEIVRMRGVTSIIASNLQRSGLFRPLDPATFTDRDLNAAVQPDYPAWQKINAQALLYGQASNVAGVTMRCRRRWRGSRRVRTDRIARSGQSGRGRLT